MHDLEEKFIAFQRSSLQATVLLAQVVVVVAALLCSQWWHYLVLALAMCGLLPLWGNLFLHSLKRWWDEHNKGQGAYVAILEQEDRMLDAEDITDTLDIMDQAPPPPAPTKQWPFDKNSA